VNTDAIRQFTLWARGLLTQEASELLLQVYGLKPDGTFLAAKHLPALEANAEARETRGRLERLLADEKDAGVAPEAAVAKLVKEVAFTHLNRLVALKMLEDPERRLIRRAALAGYPEPNGFKMYLPDHEEDYRLYQQGTAPLDELGESPRDRAYRHFLLWQYGELAKEVRVLFDPDNLASRLFPRPKVLRQVIERLNGKELNEAWKPGNEETIGWVYQFFQAEESQAAWDRVLKKKQKFQKSDIPVVTQIFTPRWIVRFLVENSLGRLWLAMHPDSQLASEMPYLVPGASDPPRVPVKSVGEIRVLDPACGSMHFGLVAFDLLVRMYREEMANAGKEGWPATRPVERQEDIPAAILANNLFGIDIDLRAVQLSALALYLRAKSNGPCTVLTDSNLACADVTIFRGPHRGKIVSEMALPRGLSRQLFEQFCDALDEASLMGSLVRLERLFQEKLRADELKTAIDGYVRKKAAEGVDESYFGSETSKGLRLLDVLMHRYDVVFTNPPYMSNRNMNAGMSEFMRREYKKSKGDLYSGFIERCAELLVEGGRVAMITQQSFMFISSYEDLREMLLGNAAIETMAHVGPRAFEEVQGEKVNTTVFVLRRESFEEVRRNSVGVYFRLVKAPDAEAKRRAFEEALERRRRGEPDPRVYEYRQGDFAAIPGSPWVYWITPGLRRLFSTLPKLSEISPPRQGLATADNTRFLRYWWEVGLPRVYRNATGAREAEESGFRWFPYMKGGSFRRWYGNQEYSVNWSRDGEEIKQYICEAYPYLKGKWEWVAKNPDFYFRRGVTYSYLTAGAFSARLSPGGFIFDVAGSSLFPDDIPLVLALLNSEFAQFALRLINPTVNFQVGDLARLPVPKRSSDLLRNLVNEAVKLARTDSEEDETTYDFIAPPAWPEGAEAAAERQRRLAGIERDIDEEVYRLYEISDDDRRAIEAELAAPTAGADENDEGDTGDGEAEADEAAPLTQEELAQRWIGYAVGIALGRFQPGVAGALGCGSFPPEIAARLRGFTDPDGLMVLEEGHPDDLARRILDILRTIYGDEEAERIVRTATGSAAPLREAVESYLLGPFWRDHVKRYRKRPIYWLIQSPKKSYSLYLFHERATADTLPMIRGNRYLGGRLNRLRQEQSALAETIAKGNLGARKRAGLIAEEIEELEEFDRRLEAVTRVPVTDKYGRPVTVRWEPELDDGVLINAAPLHELLPSWREVNPKNAWQALEAGAYDWSKTAMRYWPQRVLAKCKENKSFAIAHGLA
jgi:hypothetical protein